MSLSAPKTPGFDLQRTHPDDRGARALWLAFDFGLAFVVMLLGTNVLNRLGGASQLWMLAYAMTLARIAMALPFWAAVFRRNLIYFVYPVICVASVIWSMTPAESLVASIQLVMSVVIAIVVGTRFRLSSLITIMLIVILCTVVLSLVNWRTGVFGQVYSGAGGLLGIYPQKNALGQKCLFGLLATVALLLLPVRRGLLVNAGLICGAIMMIIALTLSQSATSILLLPIGVGVLLVLCYHRLSPGIVFLGITVGVSALAFVPFVLAIYGIDPIDALLGALGKNSTLTGRTKLWDIAGIVLEDRYWLGTGFLAFWRAPEFANLAYLAQEIGGENVRAFHNFIIEILVGTGILGLCGILSFIVTSYYRSIRAFMLTRDVMFAFSIVAVTISVVMSFVVTTLYNQHEFVLMFLVMIGVSIVPTLREMQSARSLAGKAKTLALPSHREQGFELPDGTR